jgi:hypothetical protein
LNSFFVDPAFNNPKTGNKPGFEFICPLRAIFFLNLLMPENGAKPYAEVLAEPMLSDRSAFSSSPVTV